MAAKSAYKEAIDAGDIDKQVAAQQALAQLAMEGSRVNQLKS